jgi:hypothetical protein
MTKRTIIWPVKAIRSFLATVEVGSIKDSLCDDVIILKSRQEYKGGGRNAVERRERI